MGRRMPQRHDALPASSGPSKRTHIRIGYVSADFYNHATVALIIGLLEHHDRTCFKTYAYSFSPNDNSPLRGRLINAVDSFVDVRLLAEVAIAKRIRQDDIDILIDLKGYTLDSRPAIFSMRPAPIQINFLGYPGTMGTRFIDYIIGDSVVTPMCHSEYYSEQIVHLPHTYQPNDCGRHIANTPTRESVGLPDGHFVYCCFNNNYKITPDVFCLWMRLLKATDRSVLWLLETSATAKKNLLREAADHGIASDRIIFAPYVPVEQHLARMQVGDLFLDTLPYNAHTTASEALWAGLPVLTCLGESFSGRVAASLLQAIGLPELITTSLNAYEKRAIELARNPQEITALREKLISNRMTSPLFDTKRYTKDFESALRRMVQINDAGRPPEAFIVSDGDGSQPEV